MKDARPSQRKWCATARGRLPPAGQSTPAALRWTHFFGWGSLRGHKLVDQACLKQGARSEDKITGFTLVELLVISPIIMMTVVAAVTFLFNQYGSVVEQNGRLNLRVEAQQILFSLQDDIWYSNLFTSTINANLTDAYAPQGGWTYNTTPQTLITSTPALTKSHRDPAREPVYINESTCTPPDGNGDNSALYENVIYFASGTNLYKRIISAPSSLALCNTPFYKQTCPAAQSSPSCPADILMSDHLSTFSVTYYDTDNNVVTTPENAESVKVDIGLADKAYGNTINASSSLRLRKINQ